MGMSIEMIDAGSEDGKKKGALYSQCAWAHIQLDGRIGLGHPWSLRPSVAGGHSSHSRP